jgi:hypothetical protein
LMGKANNSWSTPNTGYIYIERECVFYLLSGVATLTFN